MSPQLPAHRMFLPAGKRRLYVRSIPPLLLFAFAAACTPSRDAGPLLRSGTPVSSPADSSVAAVADSLAAVALDGPDADARIGAVRALAASASPSAVPVLAEVLRADRVWMVRRSAAEALGELRRREAVPALLSAMRHRDWQIRRASADALGRIGDPEAFSGLLPYVGDPVSPVRRSVAGALLRMQEASGGDLYRRALSDRDPDVRRVGALASGLTLRQSAVPMLGRMLRSEDEPAAVREAAAEALGRIGGDEAVEALVEGFRGAPRSVRRSVLGALGSVGPAAFPRLVRGLSDRDPAVALWCRWSLEAATGMEFGRDAARWNAWMEKNVR